MLCLRFQCIDVPPPPPSHTHPLDDLLKNVANLFDNILDGSEKILQDWVSSSLVDAICEGIQQTRYVCTYVKILNWGRCPLLFVGT